MVKHVTVGNAVGHYHLWCNSKAAACISPVPNKDYYVFSKETHWQFPGATKVADLAFFQDWSVTYNNQENIALVTVKKDDPIVDDPFGMYALDSWEKK